jgi:hypothetical protein
MINKHQLTSLSGALNVISKFPFLGNPCGNDPFPVCSDSKEAVTALLLSKFLPTSQKIFGDKE